MSPPAGTVAVLGGYGDVGGAAARALWRTGVRDVRLGGRDGSRAAAAARAFGPEATGWPVDHRDAVSLAAFVAGANVVVDAASTDADPGAGHRIAAAAREAGADLVTASDADPAALGPVPSPRVVVTAAGLEPGLTALLPRWLAREFARVETLWSCLAVLDRLSSLAARDYLYAASAGHSVSSAAWRHGPRRRALTRRTDVHLLGLSRPAELRPHLDAEGQRTAAALGVARGDWYVAVLGEHVSAAFDRVGGLTAAEGAALLENASALDLAGREPSVTLFVRLGGVPCTGPDGFRQHGAVLRAGRAAEVTGAVAALAGLAVLNGSVATGAWRAGETLDPAWVLDRLPSLIGATLWTTAEPFETAGPVEFAFVEEGAL
ncbi:hypothetical protein DMP23_20250 [Amycolatopsis sp. A1MSW2902]|uniref:saccharopine dehydrogenase NADP-binding domain-containing protein n=1 Tax=Amycolatopsis sp. A1MSW2902 TaxID=687413 RepID=UPI00307F8B35